MRKTQNAKPTQIYKCSAVAEMGNSLATINMGRKHGGLVPL